MVYFAAALGAKIDPSVQAGSVMQGAASVELTTALKALQFASNIVSWVGAARSSQGMQAGDIASKISQLIQTTNQTGTMTATTAGQLQVQQMQLTAIARSAVAEQFSVLPSGQVIIGPQQWIHINAVRASGPHGPAKAAVLQRMYQARATAYTAQIQALMGQTTMTDTQAALQLLKTVIDLVTKLSGKDAAAATASSQLLGQLPVTVPGTSLAGVGGTTLSGYSPLGGTALTGIGGLGGAGSLTGAGLSMAGAGAVGGVGVPAGVLAGTGIAAAGGAGVRGGGAAGRGIGAAGAGGFVGAPYGGGHGAGDGSSDEFTTKLVNDNDIFAVDEAPGPVLGATPEA